MSNQTVFDNFILQINDHNVDGIIALISDDFVLIDERGFKIEGRDNVENHWTLLFKVFPDYKIIIDNSTESGTLFLASGTASGTYGSRTASGDNYWNIPAACRAEIDNAKVKSWQMFADTKVVSDIIEKYSSGGTDSKPYNDNTKVTGIGGVFFKAKDPKALREWYNKHLGTSINDYSYMNFEWSERGNAKSKASTTFGLFSEKSKYFDPSTKDFMINFRVKNLKKLLEQLKADGVTVMDKTEEADYGKFGWIMDIEGNKIELWEPVDEVLDDYEKSK